MVVSCDHPRASAFACLDRDTCTLWQALVCDDCGHDIAPLVELQQYTPTPKLGAR